MHRRLLTLARDSRLALSATILAGLLAGLLTILQAATLSRLVDRVYLGGQAFPAVWGLLRLLLIVIGGRAILTWAGEVSARTVAVQVKNDLRGRLLTRIMKLGPGYTRGERAGELTATVVEAVEALDAYFSQYLPQIVVAGLVPLSILIVVFPRDPLSGFVLLVTAPLIPVFMYLIGKAAEALTRRQWDTLGRLSANFLESLRGLETLKLFGRSRAQADSIAAAGDRYRDATLKVLRVTFLSALVLELVATISTAIVAVEVGLRLLYGQLAFQEAFFLLLLAPEFYVPLRMLGLRFHAGTAGVAAAGRIFQILDLPSPGESRAVSVNRSIVPGPSSIALERVSFTYPGESRPALDDVSLEIPAGAHVALVGRSGAGKSTLASLLLRFLEPSAGRLCLDAIPAGEMPLDDWRSAIAWVPQRPYLFNTTISANLRLARQEAGMDELAAAARAAHLDEFIQSLPDGYETVVGEGGARLSGGQAQRLALARAFLRDASILILDEPTSGLDAENEALIVDSLARLMRRRTVLTIAHRLATVCRADRIFVLEEGRLIETGTHVDLLKRGGVYTRLVRAATIGEEAGAIETTQPQSHEAKQAIEFVPSCPDGSFPGRSCNGSVLFRLLGFLHGAWGWVALSVLLGALTIGANVGLMGASAWLISAAALHPGISALEIAIVGVRFFGIARGVFRYLERLVSHDVTFRLLARLRAWFYRALEPLAPARLMQFRSGDLLSRISSDVDSLENFYVRLVAPPLVALIVAVGTGAFLARYDLRLAWAFLSIFFLLAMGLPWMVSLLARRPGAALVAGRSELHTLLVDTILGLPDLTAFGRAADVRERIRSSGAVSGRTQQRLAQLSGAAAGMSLLFSNLGMWFVLILAIPLVSSGRLGGVMLAPLAMVALAAFEAALPLPPAAQVLAENLQAARRLFAVVDTTPEVVDPPEPRRVSGFTGLVVRNLSLTYNSGEAPAVDGINFDLPPGKRVAIVGPSGAGKSTLVNILVRFWEYSDGKVLLNGHDLREYSQGQVRESIGLLSQNPYLFGDTIRRNLLLANSGAGETELCEACRKAQIAAFIDHLSSGYETMIGESGLRLSGGERRRLALARLLLKDSPLLVLDEPTADLDPQTERLVLAALSGDRTPGRSLLLLTHRLVGLDAMDEILVLRRGCIVERGTHVELLHRGGIYRRMWELQNGFLGEGE